MNNIIFILVLSSAITLCLANFRTTANFTDDYGAIFDVYTNADGVLEVKVSLIYSNLPLNLEKMGGMWLGIGFGKSTMLGSDIVIC